LSVRFQIQSGNTLMLPEVKALHRIGSSVRIPPADNVPISDRVRRVIDSPPLRRLASISQLGMVALVYPGATHSRLEHSLGVYYNALRLLARFTDDPDFVSLVDQSKADAFVLAALVHDIGHWPFCHPIEDMDLSQLGEHESRIQRCIEESELQDCVASDWNCDLDDVLMILKPNDYQDRASQSHQLLASCISGPIDIDKLDYLQRDSLHCGVPYGRNFDVGRLINSMCVNPETARLAIGEKGRTAAEMMVFARYVMFSEVYWHHAVRSATAMLQRAVFCLRDQFDLQSSLQLADAQWIDTLGQSSAGSPAEQLVTGLFGSVRRLYKRVAEFNVTDGVEVHRQLARRPYWWLVACAEQLAERLSKRLGIDVASTDILIDAPPAKLEVDINVDVVGRDGVVRGLGEVSPVASALAEQQFDSQVKRVRVFVREDLRNRLCGDLAVEDWTSELLQAVESTNRNVV
jgi:HD superfamily phosphohydrolase